MRFVNAIVLLFIFLTSGSSSENSNISIKQAGAEVYGNDFEEYLRTLAKEIAACLKMRQYPPFDLEKLQEVLDAVQINSGELKFLSREQVLCGVCKLLIHKIQTNGISVELLGKAVCDAWVLFTTQTVTDFCAKIIALNKPVLEYIVRNSKILDPEYACSVLLQSKNCYYSHPALQWNIEIPNGKIQLPQVHEDPEAKPLKVLHLSDFHISPDYEINGVTWCGYPVCCKKGLGNPVRGKNSGKWGEYNCDIPPWLYTDTLGYINNTHKDIDWIYFTGDIIDHTVWEASYQNNSELIVYTYEHLNKFFPKTKIYSVIGNHESVPLNIFAPPEITDLKLSQKWLYILLANLWGRWLPQSVLDTVQQQGFYSVTIRKNLKIIALNNNICYIYNWWVLHDTQFLRTQLNFLRNHLDSSEKNGQFVHIISHIPPGNKECIEPWEKNYNELITRYSHIIKGQFFGHTHTDELKIFYNKSDGKPNNVGYNGASLTPSPRWYKLYSMKEAYDLDKLSPENFEKLVMEMKTDNTKFRKYWRYYVREGDAALKDGCDDKCKKELLCQITKVESLSTINEC